MSRKLLVDTSCIILIFSVVCFLFPFLILFVKSAEGAQIGSIVFSREYGSSEQLLHVRNRGCIAAVSPGIAAVIRKLHFGKIPNIIH